jgi:hypothetical protein
MKGADHFFRGQEKDLMDILGTHSGHLLVPCILYGLSCGVLSFTHCMLTRKGHWILKVFPQCKGDLKALADSHFPLYEVPSESMNSDGDVGCPPFTSD